MSGSERRSGLTRRGFLTASMAAACLGGLSSLTACAPKSDTETGLADTSEPSGSAAQQDAIYCGVCRAACAMSCFLNYHVRDGKVVRVSMREFPDPDYNRICLKGVATPGRIYNAERVKYPLRRVGERGGGEWERISWEEAIETITTTWKNAVEEYGPNAVGYVDRSYGSEGRIFSIARSRLRNLAGGAYFQLVQDSMPYLGCFNAGFGPYGCNADSDMRNSKALLFANTDFTESIPQHWHWAYEAQQNGAKIIVVDPVYTVIASKADIWLPIRPGTDMPLFAAMTNVVFENGHADLEFLAKNTVAPFLVKEDGTYLRKSDLTGIEDDSSTYIVIDSDSGDWGELGEVASPAMEGAYTVEGQSVTPALALLRAALAEYTPERAAEICDVPAEDIRMAVDLYCQNSPGQVRKGYGADHRWNAQGSYDAMGAFVVATGSMGKAGSDYGYHSRFMAFNDGAVSMPEDIAPLAQLSRLAFSQLPIVMETQRYGELDTPLRVLICQGGDYLHHCGERLRTIKAMDSLDLLVSINMSFNDTSQYADIVLPVCEWCETEDASGMMTFTPYLTHQQKAIDPQFESKDDFEICKLIAEGLGHLEWFDLTREDVLKLSLGDDVYERLMREHAVPFGVFEADPNYIYGADGVWWTQTGKVQFYMEKCDVPVSHIPYREGPDWENVKLPKFVPPHEAWNYDVPGYPANPLAARFPLQIHSPHKKWNKHTTDSHNPFIRELDPEPCVYISEKDASDRGISEGDYVRVFNDRGEVVLLAHIHAGEVPGFLSAPNGWTASQYISGHYGDLTPLETDPDGENCVYSDTLVEVEKYEVN